MKHSGFVSGVILVLLLIVAVIGAVLHKQWVLLLIIVCLTLWVLILLIKQNELTQENTRLVEVNATLASHCAQYERLYLGESTLSMRAHDNECE